MAWLVTPTNRELDMAESVLKLKVESTEYNNKIKRAAEGLQQYADRCRKAGAHLKSLKKTPLNLQSLWVAWRRFLRPQRVVLTK